MKLQRFDGGIASRLAPQLLNINQGAVYENIDNATGILTPVKDKLATAIEVEKYAKYFVAENKWLSSPASTDYLEFQKVMYIADRVNIPQKFSNNVYSQLGITKPVTASVIINQNLAVPLKDITVLNKTTSGDLPAADLDYMLFNVNNGIYSAPFKFTVYASSTSATKAQGVITTFNDVTRFGRNSIITEDNPTNRSVQFKNIKGAFANTALLFRFYDGDWRLLKTFANKADSFVDSVYNVTSNALLNEDAISPFNGTYQYVYTYYNSNDGIESAPSKLSKELKAESGTITVTMPDMSTDPQVTKKRLYRVGGLATQFTLVAELNSNVTAYIDTLSFEEMDGRQLESDNYYAAPRGLKYLVESYAMLFGALGSSLRFTPIGKPNAWPPEYEIQFDQDITSIGSVANGLLVCTKVKTFIVTGTGPTSLAQQSLRGDQGCIAFESMKEAVAGTLIWASEDGLCSSSGNNVVSLTKDLLGDIELDPISAAVNNEVYYCHNKDGTTLAWDYRFQPLLKWLNFGITTLAVANGNLYGSYNGLLYNLYKGAANLSIKYKSPLLTEGSFSENKTYKKVYVRSEGDIIISILIDSEIVATFELTETATHQLQVPQQLQRGYSIQFEVSGTGTINELEYTVGQRQNG